MSKNGLRIVTWKQGTVHSAAATEFPVLWLNGCIRFLFLRGKKKRKRIILKGFHPRMHAGKKRKRKAGLGKRKLENERNTVEQYFCTECKE